MEKQYFVKFYDRKGNFLTINLFDDKKTIRHLCARLRDERDISGFARWVPCEVNVPFEASWNPRTVKCTTVEMLAYALQHAHARDFMQWLIEEAYTEDIILAVIKYEETREKLWEDNKPVTFTNLKNAILNK